MSQDRTIAQQPKQQSETLSKLKKKKKKIVTTLWDPFQLLPNFSPSLNSFITAC